MCGEEGSESLLSSGKECRCAIKLITAYSDGTINVIERASLGLGGEVQRAAPEGE